ncbi:Cna B-type domain-containing protein [Collinsella sp. zg1085]|uniref:Cna B-type domain-containing protein n=1 Tax=Collinsella sp. zg1085 TaxID=2844380 RepID=UPI001C0CB75D|nr:leucine-rich repeat protein [Collinsella sp. zg1085]QWT17552.1 Cna B-type domain-containing protein [Collinsella sp. zg1085]
MAYRGSSTTLEIPATLSKDGETYPVTSIAEHAFDFAKTGVKLTELTLPDGLVSIGEGAFAFNALTKLVLPRTVADLGDEAFAYNKLSSLELAGAEDPATANDPVALKTIGAKAFLNNEIAALDFASYTALTEIKASAFSGNRLETLNLPASLKAIGDSAFKDNQLAELVLPDAIETVGVGAFYDNKRYVFLTGGAASAVSTDVERGHFGSIYRPITLWVKGIDAVSNETILSPREISNNPYSETTRDKLMFVGNDTAKIVPPVLPKYVADTPAFAFTNEALAQNSKDNPVILTYKPNSTNPMFHGLTVLQINVDGTYNLLDGVTATDGQGNDITDRITVKPDRIDTSAPSEMQVVYSVTDQSGNSATATRLVLVGLDPMERETGKGWLMKDFTYDGDTVTGLSESGKEKIKTNKDVVLPSFNPTTPEGTLIRSIGASAFIGQGIASVDIPESVTSIERQAFDSNALTEIKLHEGLTTIDDDAFGGNRLISVSIPSTVKFIGVRAFKENRLLTIDFAPGLEFIGAEAFADNELATLAFPNTLKKVGRKAFVRNKLVDVAFNDGLQSIEDAAFLGNLLTAIDLPSTLTTLGNEVFKNNQLKNVEIPASVTEMGESVFENNLIESFTWNSPLTKIPFRTFRDNHLREFSVPNHITELASGSFEGNRFEKVDIPSTITSIGSYAFHNNYNLKTLALHEGIVSIGNYAFSGTALEMERFETPSTLRSIGERAFYGGESSKVKMIIKHLVLNEGLTSLGSGAFANVYLQDVSIPESVTEIKDYTFNNNNLTRLDIPSKVTSIGYAAFKNNYISHLNLPKGLLYIHAHAFENNRNLRELNLPSTVKTIEYSAFANNKIGKLDVPASVERIESSAFEYNHLREINLKDSLGHLGYDAFSSNHLTDVRLPVRITEVPESVFSNNRISHFELAPNTTRIGRGAFENNQLSDVHIPEGVLSVGDGAFRNNLIETLTLPESLTDIDREAFRANKLSTVDIPAAVTKLGDKAFNSNRLSTVTIPNDSHLTTIGDGAFTGNKLTDLRLPTSVTTLPSGVLNNNPGWNETPGRVRVMVRDEGDNLVNPHNLAGGAGHHVNSSIVRINHVLEGSGQPIAEPNTHVATIGERVTVIPKETAAYQPVSTDAVSATVTETPNSIDISYRQNPNFKPDAVTVTVNHASGNGRVDTQKPNGLKQFSVGSEMPIVLRLQSSGDLGTIPNAWLVLDLNSPVPGGHVPEDITWPSNMASYAKSWKVENGQVKIELKDPVSSSTSLEIPLFLRFKKGETPNQFVLDLTGKARLVQNDQILKSSDTSEPIGLLGFANSRQFYKSTDKDLIMGAADPEGYIAEGTDLPIKFTYVTSSSDRYTTYREINRIKLKDIIPTYTGKDEHGVVHNDLKAKFVPELSPGWKLSADGESVELDEELSNTTGGTSSLDVPVHPIYFRFPRAKVDSRYRNRMSGTMYGVDRRGVLNGSYEEIQKKFKGKDTVWEEEPLNERNSSVEDTIKAYTLSTPTDPANVPQQGAYIYVRNASFYGTNSSMTSVQDTPRSQFLSYNFKNKDFNVSGRMPFVSKSRYGGHYANAFRDNDEDRHEEFVWATRVVVEGGNVERLAINQFGLDSRMYYTGFKIPKDFKKGELTVYDGDNMTGNVLLKQTVYGDRFDFPEAIRKKVKSFKLEFEGKVDNTPVTTTYIDMPVYSRLLNPDDSHFVSAGANDSGLSAVNRFYAKASFELDGTASDRTTPWTASRSDDTEYILIVPWESRYSLVKTLRDAEKVRDYNELLYYDLSTSFTKPEKSTIESFKFLDLLPKSVEPVEVQYSQNFLDNAVNPSYEYIENFENTGRWAVVVKADSYNPGGEDMVAAEQKFMTLVARTTTDLETSTAVVNEAYLTGQGDSAWSAGGSKPGFKFFKDDKTVLSATASFPVFLGAKLEGFKYIRRKGSPFWSPRSVRLESEEAFEYRLEVNNATSSTVKDVQIFDVLPYNKDTRVVANEDDVYVDRNTDISARKKGGALVEDRAHMTGPIRSGDGYADDYDVYYTTADSTTLKGRPAAEVVGDTSLWVTADQIGDWGAVTAFKIIAKPGRSVPGNSSRNFYVDMKAPKNEDYMFDGDKMYNTFAQRSGNTGLFIEGNSVEAEMYSKRGILQVKKLSRDPLKPGETHTPLAGAKFRLWAVAREDLDEDDAITTLGDYRVLKNPIVVTHNGAEVDELTTNASGVALFTELKMNRDYVIEEVSSPEGHKIVDKYTLVNGEDLRNDTNHYKEVEVINQKLYKPTPIEPLTGTLEFYKVDATGLPIPSTGFTLEGGPKGPNHVKRFVLSSETGLVRFENLPLFGEEYPYTLTETNPRGALHPIDPVTVRFKNNGVQKPVINLGSIKNDKGDLLVAKLGIYSLKEQNNPIHKLTRNSGRRLAGVELQLQDKGGAVLEAARTNARGEAVFKELEIGRDYYIFEPTVPPTMRNYENAATNNRVKVRIERTGVVWVNDVQSSNNYAVMPNFPERNTNRVDLIKTDENDNLLPGAVFGLFEAEKPADGQEPVFTQIATQTTDDAGQLSFEDFGVDTSVSPHRQVARVYEIRELTSPVGYVARFKPFRFETSDDTLVYFSLEAMNPSIHVKLKKFDADNRSKALPGAVFGLYAGAAGEGVPLEQATTNAEGEIEFAYRDFDMSKTYSIKEITAPDGYATADTSEVQIIDLPGLNRQGQFDGKLTYTFYNRPVKGRLELLKFGELGSMALSGVQFTLVDPSTGANHEADRVVETDAQGSASFTDLTIGKEYKLSETRSLPGYRSDEHQNIAVRINSSATVRLELVNHVTPVPFSFSKQDKAEHPIIGAQFRMERELLPGVYVEPVMQSSDQTGQVSFTHLVPGQVYRLTEVDVSSASSDVPHGADNGWQRFTGSWTVKPVLAVENGAPKIEYEVVRQPDGEAIAMPLTVVNERVEPTPVTVKVKKTFNGGTALNPLPSFKAVLTRYNEANEKETVGDAKAMTRVDGEAALTLSAEWTGLDYDYYDATARAWKPWRYEVEEQIEGAGADSYSANVTLDAANSNTTLRQFNIVNTYTPAVADVTATKTWSGGEALGDRPTVYFKLFRALGDGAAEAVAGADIKELSNGTSSVVWNALPKTDATGVAYTYSVREVDAQGADATPNDYTKDENGLSVTNTYTSPTADVSATKTWVGGEALGDRPTTHFKLFRAVGGADAVAVEGADIKELPNGTTSVTWAQMPVNDEHGNAYTYSVQEVDEHGAPATPTNYEKVESGLAVTNTYVSPTSSVRATKIWTGGEALGGRPTTYFKLFRAGGAADAVAVDGAELKELPNGTTSVEWANMPTTDASGNLYTYSVLEVDEHGTPAAPANYNKVESGLSVTNTYTSPTADVSATKTWVGGEALGDRPTTYFKLFRAITGGNAEAVDDAEIKELPHGTTSVSWSALPTTDASGNTYTYSVKEVDAQGSDAVPTNYKKTENGLGVTNTYVSPTADVSATKTWVGGEALGDRPTTYFKLFRSIPNGDAEAVANAETKELPNGTTEVSWQALPTHDEHGNVYTYSVQEVDSHGTPAAPANYNKVESGLSVTNTYTSPTADVSATKTWVGGEALGDRPTTYFKLFRAVTGGNAEAVDDAEIKELPQGTTSVSWSALPTTDASGNTYTYSVKEVDAQGSDAVPANYKKTENGLGVTNTYVSPTADVSATKTWVGGEALGDRPTTYFKLFRSIPNGDAEAVANAETKELPNGTTEVSWQALPTHDEHGNVYTYSVQEVDSHGTPAAPTNYNKVESGLSVTNTYTSPTADVSATKTWVGGEALGDRPTTYFKLFRAITGGNAEAVDDAEIKELPQGTTSVSWSALPTTDASGNTYTYSVKEVDAQGSDAVPANYKKTENGLGVTNTYVSPTADVSATKTWVNGPSEHPAVWFKLFRKIEGSDPEAVPSAEAAIKKLENGTTEATWSAMPTTDPSGKTYQYSVHEVNEQGDDFTPTNYTSAVSDNGLTVTNTYVIPKNGEARATKTWVNGSTVQSDIWLRLYRQIEGGQPEAVPSAEAPLHQLTVGTTETSWNNLSQTDINGNAYTFSVREVDEHGDPTQPENFTKLEDGLTVTNTYVVPTIEVKAIKTWVNGPATHPDVWFKLFRKVEGGQLEEVDTNKAPIKKLENGTTEASWANLEKTDIEGRTYEYSVQEVDANGADFTPEHYIKTENGLKVTNTYEIPNRGSARATKAWVNGPAEHPAVWFKLYRQIAGSELEEVPAAEAPIQKLENGTTQVLWNNLSQTDINGNAYTFSVKEVNEQGADFTPENYTAETSVDGLTVTNTYVIPKTAEATAHKAWVNGPAEHPAVWFKLYRQVEGGQPEAVPTEEAPIKKLENGTTEVSWTGLSKTDINGNAYTFSVHEVNDQGVDFTPENYTAETSNDGLTVTNTYVIPKTAEATAHKTWVNGPAIHPTVWFKLFRAIEGGQPEAVPAEEAPIKKLENGTTEASWTGLSKTDINGNAYTFTVKEVDEQGSDFTPENYTAETSNDGLTVTNTYVPPTAGRVSASKVWVNGPATHPDVWFKLYRMIAGAQPEEVPTSEAPLRKLENGTTEVLWTGLTQTDINGNPYTFMVHEVNEQGADFTPTNYTGSVSADGLTVTNTYVIPTQGEATATKAWVNGPAEHPTVWFKLYRQIAGGELEEVPAAEAPIQKLENGTTQVLWNNLSQTDINGNAYTFSVKEVNEQGADFTPENYTAETSVDGLTVTNTYVIPKTAEATAHKAWVNGPAEHPAVWFKLYRQVEGGQPEAVPTEEAPIKKLENGTTEVSWTGLSKTDINGNAYTFSVHEVNDQGVDFTPENYTAETSNDGLTVTNTYVIPKTAEATAHKTWVNGPAIHPTVWFKLFRAIEGGQPEAVPAEEAPIKKLENGTTEASWTGLSKTDINGNAYTFSVKEVDEQGADFTPENYTAETSNDGLTITNSYVIPKTAEATAHKAWVNGPDTHPTVWFKLFRAIEGGQLEAVPAEEAPIKKLENGTTEVSWTGLSKTDINGNVYTFSVHETNADGNDAVPTNYALSMSEDGLTVTNTYVAPKQGEATAHKTWVNGPAEHPTVWFKLFRAIEGGQPEAVPTEEAPIKKLENGSTEVSWTHLTQTDEFGNAYTFTVKEVDEQGADFTPENYTAETSNDGLTVTNTYVIPKTAEATAHKAWVNGPATHPTVWFKLFRAIEGGQLEAVPTEEAPIKKLENGTTEVSWTGLSKTDINGNVYTFSVHETNADGNDAVPTNYALSMSEDGLTVTNTYVAPKQGEATAHKTWVNGPAEHPTVWFKLFRAIEGGQPEAVPTEEAPIKKLENGSTEVSWTHLTQTDEFGNAYTFTVKEVDEQGADFTPENYTAETSNDGLTVTNTYVIPKTAEATAHKAWVNGPATHPTVWFKLFRAIEGGQLEAVPTEEAPIKKLENGTTEVSWTGLSKTDINGNVYIFSVKEVDEQGDDFTPENYTGTVSKDGLTVTNTYVAPTQGEATATKAWVNGPAAHPTVWFKLFRAIEDGQPEAVPTEEAPIKKLSNGITEVSWTHLTQTDEYGNAYTFTVRETDADGNDAVPASYAMTMSEDGLTVTNTYVAPTRGEATATKEWVNGPATHPTVWFKLYRQVEGSDPEEVPTDEAPLRELANGTTEASWTGLTQTDINGNEYSFSVREVDAEGNDFVPEQYVKTENGLAVTNTYVVPNMGMAKANKVWKDALAEHPTIWLRLYRQVEGGKPEAVPTSQAAIQQLTNGTTEVAWVGLDQTDERGNVYTFLVREVDAAGNSFVPENYRKAEEGLTVTNTYVAPPSTGTHRKTRKIRKTLPRTGDLTALMGVAMSSLAGFAFIAGERMRKLKRKK